VVAGDVAAVDVNMGCPKRLAIASGTGAALCGDPDRAAAIVAALQWESPYCTHPQNIDIDMEVEVEIEIDKDRD
jgi:tRNA-dihydrouridine synthase 2